MRQKKLTKSEMLKKAKRLDDTAHDTSDRGTEAQELRNKAWAEAVVLYRKSEE